MKLTRKEVLSIPNILSFIRLLLIPIFIVAYCNGNYYFSAVIILVSGLTDLLDGIIARKFNMITEFGKLLDPVADKLTQGAVVFLLIFRYRLMFYLFILLFIKEITMAVNDYILYKKGTRLDGAKWFGKLSTAILYAVMIALIGFPNLPIHIVNGLIVLSGSFLVLSFVLYMAVFASLHKSVKEVK